MEGERGGEEHWEIPKSKGNPAGVSSCQEATRALKNNTPSEVQCTQSLPDANVKDPVRCPEGRIHSNSPTGD